MEIQPSNLPGLTGQVFPSNSGTPRARSATTETSVAAANQQPTKALAASKAELENAVATSNNFLKTVTNALEFSIDKDSGNTVVKVVDTATKEVIRQYPSEEMLAIAKALDKIQGLLIQQKA